MELALLLRHVANGPLLFRELSTLATEVRYYYCKMTLAIPTPLLPRKITKITSLYYIYVDSRICKGLFCVYVRLGNFLGNLAILSW